MYYLILHGRRLVQLQKYLNLRLPLNPLQNVSAFPTSSVALDVSSKDGLKVKTLPVSCIVESISRKVSFEKKGNADSVLSLLRSHGFKDSQISSIITDYPRLLVLDAEKSISSKLTFLKSREGVSTSELTEIVSTVPKILGMRWEKAISVYYDFVKEIIEADKSSEFGKLCHLPLEGCKQGNKMRNVMVLRELGVPRKVLFSLLFSNSGVCCGKEKFEESLKKVVEMGFNPRTTNFVKALLVIQGMTEKAIEEKINIWKGLLGFSVDDVWKIFKKCPMLLACSKKKISNMVETFTGLGFSKDEFVMMVKRLPTVTGLSAETVKEKTEFLVKNMNWSLKALVLRPQVFGYSMEKRIVPRCNVIKALMTKGLLGSELPSLRSVLASSDQVFLNQYVKKHDDKELVAELIAIFTGNLVKDSIV